MAGLSSPLPKSEDFDYVSYDLLGTITGETGWTEKHIQAVIEMPLVDTEAIRNADLTVAVDAVNSVGGIVIPALLKALGVKKGH